MSKSRNYYTLWLIYFMEYYEIIKHIFQRTMTWEMDKIVLNGESYLCHFSFTKFERRGYILEGWTERWINKH